MPKRRFCASSRLWYSGFSASPRRRSSVGQRIRAISQALGRICALLRSASRLALRDPLPADVTYRLLDCGPILLLGRRQLQRGLECRNARIRKRRYVIRCQLWMVRPLC
jgi:hypothetical protein